MDDLPDTISIFPLSGALLLPRARAPLHIFEPRYLQMLDDTLKTSERLIGMIQPLANQSDSAERLQLIGCAGRLTQFAETEDSRYLITLTGVCRFRVVEEVDGFAPYRRFKVSWDGFERDLGRPETDPLLDRSNFFALLKRYFDANGLSTEWATLEDADDELLINSLSMMLDLDPSDKQALLEAPSLETRRETLTTLLEFSMRGGDGERLQ